MDTWQDWASAVGLVLTVVGFGITWLQLARTRKVAVATRDTVQRATDRVRYNQLLVLLPQLQNLEPELDASVREEDFRSASRTLVRWTQLASQVHGILVTMGTSYEEVSLALRESCVVASASKGDLVEEKGIVKDLTRDARERIAGLSADLGKVLGSISTEASAPVESNQAHTASRLSAKKKGVEE